MTPKEKAEELISLEISAQYPSDLVDGIRLMLAQKHAIIFAQIEINSFDFSDNYELSQYWKDVINEIKDFNKK